MFHILARVKNLRFTASSNLENAGWNGKGTGELEVDRRDNVIIYKEKGSWTTREGAVLAFRNTFRWTHIPQKDVYQLEHLRYGVDKPVFLFDLIPMSSGFYASTNPHLCAADTYAGELTLCEAGFSLLWTIKGPRKDEKILYEYF